MKIDLTPAEARAALDAIGQMTTGNARDFAEWRLSTSGTRQQWDALLRAEAKILAIARPIKTTVAIKWRG